MKLWYQLLRMESEMASELKQFMANLEPIWEDPHEFEWLQEKTDALLSKN